MTSIDDVEPTKVILQKNAVQRCAAICLNDGKRVSALRAPDDGKVQCVCAADVNELTEKSAPQGSSKFMGTSATASVYLADPWQLCSALDEECNVSMPVDVAFVPPEGRLADGTIETVRVDGSFKCTADTFSLNTGSYDGYRCFVRPSKHA